MPPENEETSEKASEVVEAAGEAVEAAGEAMEETQERAEAAIENAEARAEAAERTAQNLADAAVASEHARRIEEIREDLDRWKTDLEQRLALISAGLETMTAQLDEVKSHPALVVVKTAPNEQQPNSEQSSLTPPNSNAEETPAETIEEVAIVTTAEEPANASVEGVAQKAQEVAKRRAHLI